jgi:hypothetical protein
MGKLIQVDFKQQIRKNLQQNRTLHLKESLESIIVEKNNTRKQLDVKLSEKEWKELLYSQKCQIS